MKKTFLILAVLAFSAPVTSFAGDFPTDLLTLSKDVSGSYFINGTATEYSFSTGHKQGNKVYATSSKDSLIYVRDLDTTTFSSDLLLTAHNVEFASAALAEGAVFQAP